ncbi:hypothetical protein BGZ63DRAFT_321903, partial [Mariannaea sp. PMI_226]
AICLQPLREWDIVRHLPCGHIFHSNCITEWFLKQHDNCPLCKFCYMPCLAARGSPTQVLE